MRIDMIVSIQGLQYKKVVEKNLNSRNYLTSSDGQHWSTKIYT